MAERDWIVPGIGLVALLVIAVSLNASSQFTGLSQGRGTTGCSNLVDDDSDGYIDYPTDPGCSSLADNSEFGTNQCDNGINDDRDGLIDFREDPGCKSIRDLSEYADPRVHCDNSVDDDKDGEIDWPIDVQCSDASDKTEADDGCIDSDRGMNYRTKSAVIGTNNDRSFNNTDYCVNSTYVKEFFCSGTAKNDTNYRCGFGCSNGACRTVPANETINASGNLQCNNGIDDDGDRSIDWPSDPGCIGSSDSSERGFAHCDNGRDDDGDGKIDYPSDPECSNVKDNTEAHDSCSDSDKGNIPATRGIITGYNNDTYYNNTDYCTSKFNLREYFCDGGRKKQTNIPCPTGCANGACAGQ